MLRVRYWLREHSRLARQDAMHRSICTICRVSTDIQRLLAPGRPTAIRPLTMEHRRAWNPRLAKHNQQDAHEAFTTLLTCCHEIDQQLWQTCISQECNSSLQYSMPIWKCFGGLYEQTLRCTVCQTPSVKIEHFNHLSLEIVDGATTLEALLANHLDAGQWSVDCQRCESRQRQQREYNIRQWPSTLVILLKRWRLHPVTQLPDQVLTHVQCDTTLDIASGIRYDLLGVVEHQGIMGGGHYVAYAHSGDGRWYHYNDSAKLVPISVEDVLALPLYVLFYSQR